MYFRVFCYIITGIVGSTTSVAAWVVYYGAETRAVTFLRPVTAVIEAVAFEKEWNTYLVVTPRINALYNELNEENLSRKCRTFHIVYQDKGTSQ